MFATAVILALASLTTSALGATWCEAESYQGKQFLHGFHHMNFSDPNHGRVNYVSETTALQKNLTYAHGDHFVIRADHTTVLDPNGPGRNSVRLESNKVYENHVTIWNIRHMPEGCGTWPAVWEFGQHWPYQGEIDILEGVNDHSPNQATLHTTANCTVAGPRNETGISIGTDCNVYTTQNAGCGVQNPTANSYGPAFNANGGGFYAMERSNAGVKVWFWPRHSKDIPQDVRHGAPEVDTSCWGTPVADFPSTDCDMASHFGPHNIVINLTFCGDWAGVPSIYNGDGCPGDCVAYVNENPAAFVNAYFDVAWLKIYE
ncbi:endo-beta-glucanase [Ganoderma leucocontextum]|nr:endo-beta-glucanase [Ganoderma leucocontextum]